MNRKNSIKHKSEVSVNCDIPEDLFKRLKEHVTERGMKMKFVVARAVKDYLDGKDGV